MKNSSASAGNDQVTHVRSTRGVRQYALAGILFGTVFPIVATAIRLEQGRFSFNLASITVVQRADPLLWIIDTAPLFLGLLATLAGMRQDALTERNWQLLQREHELTGIQGTLELRVQGRTQDLEQRNREMRHAVLVTRRVSRIGRAPELVASAAQAVAEMAPGYRVDLYLLDVTGSFAALVASSAGAEAESTIRDRQIRIGDPSIVGRVAASGRSVVTQADVTARDGPTVGDTIALPLVVRGRVIGVLGLQPDSSTEQRRDPNPELLQLVADQLAATIDSSRLFDETRLALEQLQRIAGQGTQQAWREFLSQRHVALQYTPAGTMPVEQGMEFDGADCVRASLTVRGQQIGSLALRRDPRIPWTDGERELAVKVAAQVASALENVRLLEDSVQRANKERRLSEITTKIGGSINMRNVLQTAVEELGRALPGSDVTLRLGRSATDEREETKP